MDNERIRTFCLALPHVKETLNWGHCLVYWAAPREIGGKMFALTDVDGAGRCRLSFHAGVEHYHELLEVDGIIPAPHLARAHWVGLERWNALRPREIEQELTRARELVFAKLPKRTLVLLNQPASQRSGLNARGSPALAKAAKTTAKPTRSRKS